MLTKEDIKALRTSTDIHFHSVNGRHWIVAGIEGTVHTKSQQILFPIMGQYASPRCREIEATAAHCLDYKLGRLETFQAFASMCDRDILGTLFDNLKVGDELTFFWERNNNTLALESVDFVCDSLKLWVLSANGKQSHWFIAQQVGRDNSARMAKDYA